MGDMFRSEKMSLVQMFIQPDAAYTTVAELGEIGCVQFRDLNSELSAFNRKYVPEVRRCDELERQLLYIEAELKKDGFKLPGIVDDFPGAPNAREIFELETRLEKTESEILELSRNEVNIRTNYLELIEMCRVLENTDGFFSEEEVLNLDFNKREPLDPKKHVHEVHDGAGFGFVAGIISRSRMFAFERMLWRISRNNIFVKRVELTDSLIDPRTRSPLYKTVFVVFFQGEHLKARVKKVCSGFHASMYSCPSSHIERQEMIRGVRTRIEDMKMVLSQTEDHRSCVLTAAVKHVNIWLIMVKKMKAIYHTMNMFNFNVTENCLIGEGWVPLRDVPTVQVALAEGSAAVGSSLPSFLHVIETSENPPTYYRSNKFTSGYQTLIDAYGVGNYREVNPALYTCITFPFLFGVMFGDLGHGFILVIFGAWMTICEKSLSKTRAGEIWKIFFGGRYIILLMGLYAMYTGFHYNELFSISVNVFGSSWRIRYNTTTVLTNPSLQLDPNISTIGVYPIGVDPIWQMADNKIIFTNSFKMKLSIILGVIHMSFGVWLAIVNYVHFKRYAYIVLQFMPQFIFLMMLFGYMCFMMFYKWVKYTPYTTDGPLKPACAPSVLILFIGMVLFKEQTALPGCEAYMYDAENTVQTVFVVVALICIPWLLLGKPLYIKFTRSRKAKKHLAELEYGDENPDEKSAEKHDSGGGGHNEDDEPMSDVWIHQGIHTVEYILSTISHTASYLRLWALSLAHSELSEVLWTMVMHMGLIFKTYTGAIGLFFIFAIWAAFTIAILVIMEGLSAFLHTLRLHWVEFMSKFYEGAGYAFEPFSFKTVLEDDEDY